MPETYKYLYNFCSNTWLEVVKGLKKVDASRERVESFGLPVLDKFYDYFLPVYNSTINAENKLTWLLDRSIINLLRPELLIKFVTNPKDKLLRDELSYYLVFIHAALGNLHFTPIYTTDEMEKIVHGELTYYDDLIMVHTLRKLLAEIVETERLAEYLYLFSDYIKPNGGKEMQTKLEFVDALIYVMFLHLFWDNFDLFKSEIKELLLKNYFYLAIVSGVPIKEILIKHLSSEDGVKAMKEQLIFNALQFSQESIPLNTSCTEWKKMIDVVRNYSVRLQGSQSSGFDQEEFIKGFYEGQEGRDAFRGWLRELLNIMFHLYE